MLTSTQNRTLWAVILALAVYFAFQARDQINMVFAGVGKLEVRSSRDEGELYLYWRGKIETPMAERIAAAFDKEGAGKRRVLLSMHSPGGALDHGAKVVKLLREIAKTHDLETRIDSGKACASMCVPVYLQGTRRTASADARFMFHEVSFHEQLGEEKDDVPEAAKSSATDRLFAKYFAPAGVPSDWISKVRTQMTGGNDVWKMGRELLDENSGIVLDVSE